MAYRFNGSGDRVEFALGPFNGHTFGAFTMAIFYKRADTFSGRVLGGFTTSADQERFFIDYVSSNLRFDSDSGNLTATSSQTPSNTSLWYLSVVTWAGGAGTARFHVHDGTSWAHADAAAGSAANTAITGTDKLKVATRNPLANTTAMDVVCVGIKMADCTDGQVQTLTRTAFADWRAFGFDWLIGFDTSLQTAGVLQDQASPGTGDETSKVGTSVVSDPAGWTWVSAASCTIQQITHCSASLPCSDSLANRSTASVSCGPSLTTTATIVKQAGKTTQATVATTATIRKQIGKQLGTVVASAATIVKQARKALSGASVATGATLTPLYLHAGVTNPKALSVSVVTTASLSAVKVTPFVPGADQQDVAALVAAVGGGIGA